MKHAITIIKTKLQSLRAISNRLPWLHLESNRNNYFDNIRMCLI